MDDTNDERSGDEEVEAAQDRSLSVIIDPSLIIPDQDTQILETWFHTFNLPTHVQELEQHLQQLEQHLQQIEDKVDALDERVSNISRQQFFHGRSIAAMIADILIHQGFDPVTGATEELTTAGPAGRTNSLPLTGRPPTMSHPRATMRHGLPVAP
jgi:hypothetical protein